MSTETTPLEVVSDEQPELAVIVRQNALPDEAAKNLQSSFAPAFAEARSILQQSRQIVVTDGSQKLQIKHAREYRLALKNVRVGADKVRKELKDESLRKGRAIDGFFNILLHITESEETRLEEQEKFAEVQEAKRKAALKVAREAICVPLGIDPNLYQLGEMSEETFQTLVEGTKLARAAQEAARVKAEADRIAKEAADAAERERIRQENERLKVEAEAREASAKKEREAAAQAKSEAEAQAKREREAAEATLRAERARLEQEAAAERQKAAQAAEEAAVKAKKEREAIEATARKEKLRLQALAEVERQKTEAARAAAESEAHKQRVAREQLEAQIRDAKEAETKAEAARVADAAQAAAAPDRAKLLNYATALRQIRIPILVSSAGLALTVTVESQRDKLVKWIEEKADAL